MLEFKPISLEDKDLFKQYLSINKFQNSEYNFTTLFAWQVVYQLEYTIIEDCLCVKSRKGEHISCYFPLGEKENVKKALETLMGYFKELGQPLTLLSLSEKMVEMLDETGMLHMFEEEKRRDFYDYVYEREKLVTLSGKKLHGKRNHFNYFQNHYEYEMKPIDGQVEEECRNMFKSVISDRSVNPEEELNATMMVLEYREALGLSSRALYVGGQLVGVILGECHHNVSVIHIAKSDVSYRGAAVALFKLFLEENLTHCTYVNFMEDMGLEGLRKAKLSYDPVCLVEKSIFRLKEAYR